MSTSLLLHLTQAALINDDFYLMRTEVLTPRYVKAVPSSMDEGIFYISSYGSALHKCCCGCG